MNEEPARALHRRLLETWNARDAEGFSSSFAPDGLMVGFDGSQVTGSEVAGHLGPIFADHPTAAYVAKVRGVRALGPQAVLLWAIAGMVPPGGADLNPAVNAVQTLVAEQHDGEWSVVLFQNTPAQYHSRPDLASAHNAELLPVLLSGDPVA